MMRFVAVATAAFLLCAGGGAAQKVDISQLSIGLDVTDPQQLKQVIGVMMMKMQGLEKENAVLHNRTNTVEAELQNKTVVEEELRDEISWLKKDREAFQNKTRVMEVESVAVRAEVEQVKKEKRALENKTQVIEGELFEEKKHRMRLSVEITEVRSALYRFSNKTNTDYTNITVRLDHCEAETAPFAAIMNRRRVQEDSLCRGSGLTAMFEACCLVGSAAGNGHRILQLTEGCDALPGTCSASCAPLFIEYFEGCQGMLDDLAPDQQQMFVGFYGGCQEVEQAAAAMLQDARPAMIFHVVVMSEAAAQQAQMFGERSAPAPPIEPIGPLPPSPSPARGAEIAQEFRRVCTTANLTVCVPQCNRLTYGFLLSIEIDGRGTVMTCNKMGVLFSWQGQASLGGYIGSDASAFFSSVVSGAAGTYLAMLVVDAGINADLSIERGQLVFIKGAQDAVPVWGSGGFALADGASLSLNRLQISGHVVAAEGATLVLESVMVDVGGCVGADSPSQVTLVDTSAPEECMVNVVFDDSDAAAFLAALGSGLPGTYVLRVVAAAAPYTVSAVSVGPQQDVRMIATAPDSSLTISEVITVAAEASFFVSGALSELDFVGPVSTGACASFAVSLTATQRATFQSPVAMGAGSSLSIEGTVASLAFPAGLSIAEGGMASIRSSSVGSIVVAMGTTWYAVDPSSNEGSVTFVDVGLLGTNGVTVIGTADGRLPGSLNVELNGLQPGGGGVPQSGPVLLGEGGAITIPPAVSAAVGQVFTDDRIAEFLATVSQGTAGMYGLQLSGTARAFSIAALHVSGGQDVRLFTSGTGLATTFTGPIAVATVGSLVVRGSFSMVEFLNTITVQDDASMVISVNDGALAPPAESALTLHGATTIGDRSSMVIRAAVATASFDSGISTAMATMALSLIAEAATFTGSVDTGAGSSLSIDGTVGILIFLAGLHTGGTTTIRSASPSSIAVAMGTTWYAVDPSSNRGSVTFGGVGLLSTDGETLIGTADGTLPGAMHVELNGLQPGGDGVSMQSGDVVLSAEGEITLPPELSMAVGQLFTDNDIVGFVATVAQGAAGMFGLQLRRAGQAFEVQGQLTVSARQDVRVFSAAEGARLAFAGEILVVGEGSLSISGLASLQVSAIAMTGGGSLSLANLALPAQALATALAGLSGAGSRLALEAVTVAEWGALTALTGTVTKTDAGAVLDPPSLGVESLFFLVLSGPCTTAVVDAHFCVGRWPGGYGPSEDCTIVVAGGGGGGGGAAGGVLGGCPIFDTYDYQPGGYVDYLTLPDGSQHSGADCPAGAMLAAGQRLAWHSDNAYQGQNPATRSVYGLAGGWQVCFA